MNRKTAAPVIVIASLAVLMSGCAGAAVQGGQVRDDLSPAAGTGALGLARGHVVVRDDLSPTRLRESVGQAVRPDAARAWSAEALREFHGTQAVQQQQSSTPWTADALREFHSDLPVTVDDDQSPLNGTD